MNWKNMKIGMKLSMGFGIVLVLLLAISGYSYLGFSKVDHLVHEAVELGEGNEFMLEKQIDHLNWVNKLSDLIFKDSVTSVQLETDDHKCGFGKWLYGEDVKKLTAKDEGLASLLDEIKAPHRQLHESATNIMNTYVSFDPELEVLLADRWIDHLAWVKNLGNSMLTSEAFKGGLDPTQCRFGKWFHSYQAEDPQFGDLLKKWEAPHAQLHESAQRIVEAMKKGDLEAARTIYHKDTLPALEKVASAYKETVGWIDQSVEKQKAAREIFHSDTLTALDGTKTLLQKVREHFKINSGKSVEQLGGGIDNTILYVIVLSLVAVLIGISASLLITRAIARPIKQGVDFARQMADGDFTQTLDIDQEDEIGVLAEALNNMVTNLGRMFKELTGGVETLSSSSTELSAISQQMSAGAEQTSGKSNTVATASEEMSSNMNTVAAAVEQAAANTNMIASAAEQMAATIKEIAQNSEKARSITGGAVSQAKNSASRVGELGQGAKEISKVTETITEISEQTNLLALNATIEAARAGEAGKGFAVVANEIKELAKQTADATGEIKSRIEGIQNSIEGTITDIEEVPKVINEVNEIVSTIATAVEEQSVTTREIAENVAQASKGIQEVTENVTQSTSVAGDIAKDISEVNQAANEMTNSSSQVNMSAGELSKLGEQLKEMVGRFRV